MVTVPKAALGNIRLAMADALGSGIVEAAETIQSAAGDAARATT